MSEGIIKIPRFVEGREFYSASIEDALRKCKMEGFEAQFMPAIIDARIGAPKSERVWKTWYSAPSLKATGKTKQGNAVVVYAHVPNYFSDPENIKQARAKGLISGAGIMPEDEFQRLLDLEDKKDVYVIDYDKLKNSGSGVVKLKDALKHPQTIPFLGGIERAEKYLERHGEVYGSKIGVWHSDNLCDVPVGRLLFVGYYYYYRLFGNDNLDNNGRFVGVRESASGAAQKVSVPSLENVLKLGEEFVPSVARKEFEQRVKAVYKC